MPATYLDASAIVKLVVREDDSSALRRYVRERRPLVSSALSRTEVLRALLRAGEPATRRARDVLARLELLRINDRVLALAAALLPPELRSLDAIHLASARQLGGDLGCVVTYDERMAAAARALRMRVASPR